MKLSDLPDINFVDVSTEDVEAAMFDTYTSITGRTLQKADPVRLFILFVADVIVQIKNNINDTGKQNLLKYAAGDNLDHLAALLGVTRIPASAATTTLNAVLSAPRSNETVIPAGTRVSTADKVYFATNEAVVIEPGGTSITVPATCAITGSSGNGYDIGEISSIVDPVPYVAGMSNITQSAGGADTEADDALRERVFEAPESFSTAGPAGAYEFRAKSVNSSISDVSVTSPSPGVVRIVPLLVGGAIPKQELLDTIGDALSADSIRPLTDKVTVIAPTPVSYNVNASYYIAGDADAATVQKNVASAVANYTAWQKAKLGRDIVPSKLVQFLMTVSGVKRVDVAEPTYTTVDVASVAQEGTVNVTMAGSEDE